MIVIHIFLLWMLGEDLPGAITARAADGALPFFARDGRTVPEEQAQTAAYHFSLAGVQLKFSGMVHAAERRNFHPAMISFQPSLTSRMKNLP